MVPILFGCVAAWGSSPDRYPVRATVELPEVGAVRIAVPPQLRTAEDPVDGTDLLLVNGRGEAVPVVRLEGAERLELMQGSLDVSALPEEDAYLVQLGERPVDALHITLPGTGAAAHVRVFGPDGEPIGEPTFVWRLPQGAQERVALPGVTGAVRVELERHGVALTRRPPVIEAMWRVQAGVPPDRIDVVPSHTMVQENGWVAYALPQDRPLPVDRLIVHAAEETFHREAGALTIPWESPFVDPLYDKFPDDVAEIHKVTLGPVHAELSEVPVSRRGERLVLLVRAQNKHPLDVTSVALELDGVQLVALDAGPGPHVLYGGAPVGTSPLWDLEAAGPELARLSTAVVSPRTPEANPEWVPPEVRSNLAVPSSPLSTKGFAWSRPVSGGSGPVRIPVPPEVLAHSRQGLVDVRLATEGLKVPHIVRRGGADPVLDGVTWDRTEEGSRSRITVTLPIDGVPLSTVVLTTQAPLFERQVQLEVARGSGLQPLRAVRWIGSDKPGALALGVGRAVGRGLVITIDNGDDPPLPIDDVQVHVPAYELVTVLPESPTALYYGDPRRSAPDYDLSLLVDTLRRRALEPVALGEPVATEKVPLTAMDRGMLAVGFGVLALGLLALLADLLRRTPAESATTS